MNCNGVGIKCCRSRDDVNIKMPSPVYGAWQPILREVFSARCPAMDRADPNT